MLKFFNLKIFWGILAIILVGGFLFWQGRSIKIKGTSTPLAASLFFDRSKDTDGDGLKDWEEVIYGTDINNPDSDGDGYNDKEEIASGYDPLKPRPDDKLGPAALNPRPEPGIDPSNLTDVFTKSIFDALAAGDVPTLAEIEAGAVPVFDFKNNSFLQSSLGNLLQSLAPPQEEIKTIQSNRQTIEKYAAEATKILESFNDEELESEEAFRAALQNKDSLGLDKAIENYKIIYNAFKKLDVPAELKQFHGDSLTMLYQTRELLILIRSAEQDPLKALMAWQLYAKIHDDGPVILALRTSKSLEKYYQEAKK